MHSITNIRPAPSALIRSAAATVEGTSSRASGPYATQQELIEDRLAAIRLRVAAAAEHVEAYSRDPRARTPWPSDLLAQESRIGSRLRATVAPMPLVLLADRFALSDTEQCVLWFLLAHELCPLVRGATRALSTEHVNDPTTDAIRLVVYGPRCGADVWRELGPDATLRRYGFIERTDDAARAPEYRQTWKLSARVLSLANDVLDLDRAVAEIATVEPPARSIDELEIAGDAARALVAAFDSGDLVLVHGRVGSGRRSCLLATAQARGLAVLTVEGRALPNERDALQHQLRAIARECRLLGLTPLIRDLDALAASADAKDRIDLVERELPGLVLATSGRPIARRWKRAPISIELAPLTGAQRAMLWRRAIPAAGRGDAEVLATMYPIAPALIDAAGQLATRRCGHGQMRPEHIEDALRALLDDRLAGLATRVSVTQTWADLVLPDDQLTAIIELMARVRERPRVYEEWGFADKVGRGLGVSALFSGPPGTGKTMAAGLIAQALRVELYQVDVSKIVSKWIGETEKNLAALFDAAEASNSILLFDEADALFAKRTEVKSSTDRHANQEVNYLLQRLESFTGICILTTNHETAIDEAFRRRLSVHVRFTMPDKEERARLWSAMIPAAAPVENDLGIEALASKYAMSGGYIRNAVLRAAFLAADEGGGIDAARLARAAQLEYEALGKVVSAHG